MRRGELLGLRWRDVDLERGVLGVKRSMQKVGRETIFLEPKTSQSRRQIALTTRATAAIRVHRTKQMEERLRAGSAWADQGLVFTDEIGGPLDPTNLCRRSFETLLERSGLRRMRFHDLRHTAATLLLGDGVHPKVVADMLGHSRISVTLDLYGHVSPAMQREAAETMDSLLLA